MYLGLDQLDQRKSRRGPPVQGAVIQESDQVDDLLVTQQRQGHPQIKALGGALAVYIFTSSTYGFVCQLLLGFRRR